MENCKEEVLKTPYPSYFSAKLTKKKNNKLSKNEQYILSLIPDEGLELGFVSNPLLFSKPLENLNKPQRNTLYNLIYNDIIFFVKGYKNDKLIKAI